MDEPIPDNYEKLKSFTKKLIQRCTANNLVDGLNARYEALGEIPLLHAVINVYQKTKSNSEKQNLLILAQFILDQGATPNCKNKDSVPLLHRAIRIKSTRFVELLCKHPNLDYGITQLESYKTALDVCIDKWPQNLELIKLLSSRNSNELQEKLMGAINEKDEKMLAFLINNKLVDVNKQDSNGWLPLNLLCTVGDLGFISTVLKLLTSNGYHFNFKLQDKYGYTPLHMACNKGNKPKLPIIKWLLEKGVDPNAVNNKGDTVLHEIIEIGEPEFIKTLLERGAKVDMPNKENITPMTKILYRPDLSSKVECLEILMTHNKGLGPSLVIDPLVLAYQKGFWIRLLGAHGRTTDKGIEREVEILKKRESFSDKKLFEHNPEYDVDKNPELSFSPASFVKAGIPAGLFGNGIGVVIQIDRLIPAWCSGLAGQVMTESGNDVNFNAQELTFKYREEHLAHGVTSTEIALKYHRLYEAFRSREYSPKDRYNDIVGEYGSALPYNEGLFRYKIDDIKAIYLAYNPQSAFYAVKFFNMIGRDVPFCTYDSAGKQIFRVNKEKVFELAKSYKPEEHDKRFELLFAEEPQIPITVSSDIFPEKLVVHSADTSKKTQKPPPVIPTKAESVHYTHGASSTVIFKPPAVPKLPVFKQPPNPVIIQQKEHRTSVKQAKK